MSVHFISVLGTSLYEPVVYHFPERSKTGKEQEFVQIAMLEEFRGQMEEDGKVSIFLTEGARKRNWEDRVYNENDTKFVGRWISGKKQEICEGRDKPGMRSILEKDYPKLWERTREITISNASTDTEIWSVFETIYDSIEENDEIIFDITHSFRSIPMLAITIINYAKILKNCSLKGIYYGAYEAAEIEEGVKYAPVVDLTIYNEILEWTNAAEAFMQYGFASRMEEMYNKKMKTVPNEEKKEWRPIKDKIKAMRSLSDAIFTCRGTDASKLEHVRESSYAQKSVKNAYQSLVEVMKKEPGEKAREIKPLYPLINKIEERYQDYFNGETNFEIGCGVVRWSIQNSMVQQGYTALEETMITYLCERYGLDDRTEKTRESIVGRTMTGISVYVAQSGSDYFKEHREEAFEEIYSKLPGVKANETEEESEERRRKKECIREIVRTIPYPFVKLCNKIKSKRNDINHFGFREEPAASNQLIGELSILYDEFISLTSEEI